MTKPFLQDDVGFNLVQGFEISVGKKARFFPDDSGDCEHQSFLQRPVCLLGVSDTFFDLKSPAGNEILGIYYQGEDLLAQVEEHFILVLNVDVFVHNHDEPGVIGIDVGCRTAVFFFRWDVSCGWDELKDSDRHHCLGYEVDTAKKIGSNLMAYVTAERSAALPLSKTHRTCPRLGGYGSLQTFEAIGITMRHSVAILFILSWTLILPSSMADPQDKPVLPELSTNAC
jgi:hypothetical protein